MTTEERAGRYLAAVPLPAEGERNASLNRTAYAVLERFALDQGAYARLLTDWIAPAGLSASEINTTLNSAWQAANGAGIVGTKAKAAPTHQTRPTGQPARNGGPYRAPAGDTVRPLPSGQYDPDQPHPLPEPVPLGAVALLEALYRPDEGVRIAKAMLGDDGREVPEDAGLVLPAAKWLEKLRKARGKPSGLWSSSKGTGVYIAHNPTTGPKDTDVTDHRYALLEFDNLPPAHQFSLYTQARIPIAALIHSGGKSVHAWVRVDAPDRKTYAERVGQLYAHFAAWHPDVQNKNPSRFSRLPDVVRFNGRQELLGLNLGCASWEEWTAYLSLQSSATPRRFQQLLAFNTGHDPSNVIGWRDGVTTRYLCKGKSAFLIGPSGIGKSSLITEFSVAWAQGKPAFGIGPSRPLKILIVQGENDDFDLAEMVQGIAKHHALAKDPDALAQLNERLLFYTSTTKIGQEFIDWLRLLVLRDKPDLVWVDPLLSFAGIDVSKQDQCTQFLRTQLQPVLEETGVVLIGVHHTGKPKAAKESASWTPIDHAYAGLGSSELVNWARAVLVLRQLSEHQFELKLAKRGRRAGAIHPDGEPTNTLFLQHARQGIGWLPAAPPEEPAEGETGARKPRGQPSRCEEHTRRPELRTLLQAIPEEGESARSLGRRIVDLFTKLRQSISENTARTTLLSALNDQAKITFDAERKVWLKGPKL